MAIRCLGIATSKIEVWHGHTRTIERFKRERDTRRTCDALNRVVGTVVGSGNLVTAVINALDAEATIGEITTAMRSALGMPPNAFDHPLPQPPPHHRNVA